MKLSIITVNLNNRDGLQKTIDSVVSQTFKDFEWIVIDGGSTDSSKELIEQYADHFAYWVSEPDKGIYNAMNKGIKVAKGEYLQFLNSGDWLWDDGILQTIFNEPITTDILFGHSLVHDPIVGNYIIGPKNTRFSAFELLAKSLPHQSTFISRRLFSKFGLYDESYKITADMKFFYNAIINGNASLSYINCIIVNYDGSGISNTDSSLCQKETERVFLEYLPVRLLDDFIAAQDVILNKGIIDRCRETEKSNKAAIRLYNTMMRYLPTRVLAQVILNHRKKK